MQNRPRTTFTELILAYYIYLNVSATTPVIYCKTYLTNMLAGPRIITYQSNCDIRGCRMAFAKSLLSDFSHITYISMHIKPTDAGSGVLSIL